MPNNCCVYGCFNSKSTNPKLTVFTLPSNKERFSEWLRLISREDLKGKSYRSYIICEIHFKEDDVIENKHRKLLKRNCFPSRFLRNVSATRTLSTQETATHAASERNSTVNSRATIDSTKTMSDQCGGIKEFAVKVESPHDDAGSLDSASTVKTESADVDDVSSLEEETVVKEEMDIESTVIGPQDIQYVPRPCKLKSIMDTTAGSSCSVEAREESASETSYSTISHQVDAGTSSVDYKDSRPHRCDICKKCFKYSYLLKRHMSTHTCKECNKCFTLPFNLMIHMRIHTSERPYNCQVCNKYFKLRGSLLRHMKTHTDEQPYGCAVCNKYFKLRGYLITHMKTHTDERPYICEVCNKGFIEHDSFIRHMMIHTGERSYNCEVCDECFSLRDHLINHLMTHTSEPSFKCEICKECFAQRDHLINHVMSHTGKKSDCVICELCFEQRFHLINHMMTHTSERSFHCEICKMVFTLRGNLINHMMMTHAIQK